MKQDGCVGPSAHASAVTMLANVGSNKEPERGMLRTISSEGVKYDTGDLNTQHAQKITKHFTEAMEAQPQSSHYGREERGLGERIAA